MLHSMLIDLIISFIVYFLFRKIGFSIQTSAWIQINTLLVLLLNCGFSEWICGIIIVFIIRFLVWCRKINC